MVLKSDVSPDDDQAGVPGATDPREQLIDEPGGAALRVGLALTIADVQHLARVRAHREDRVIPENAGVAEGRALLVGAVDLADEAVDIDHQRQLTRSGAGVPHPHERAV